MHLTQDIKNPAPGSFPLKGCGTSTKVDQTKVYPANKAPNVAVRTQDNYAYICKSGTGLQLLASYQLGRLHANVRVFPLRVISVKGKQKKNVSGKKKGGQLSRGPLSSSYVLS